MEGDVMTPGGGFNNSFNTMGIGDPIPAGACGQLGSGDRFGGKVKKKKESFHHQTELPYIVYSNKKG